MSDETQISNAALFLNKVSHEAIALQDEATRAALPTNHRKWLADLMSTMGDLYWTLETLEQNENKDETELWDDLVDAAAICVSWANKGFTQRENDYTGNFAHRSGV